MKTLPVGSVVYGGGLELGRSERGGTMKTEQEIRERLAWLRDEVVSEREAGYHGVGEVMHNVAMKELRWVLGEVTEKERA